MYQHLPLQDPPKFTRIWIFGLKTNQLATLKQGDQMSLLKTRQNVAQPLFLSKLVHILTCGKK
jgi:hypothetical protein